MELSIDPILKYFPDLSEEQKNKFKKLYELYSYWNERINLISRKDIDKLYINHVLHSLSIAKFTRFNPKTSVLDLGTGGGFPGIPLAIIFPETTFHLIDGTAKKIMVVKEIIAGLELKNAKASQIRAEELREKYDFVVNRAVADAERLWLWARPLIRKKGINGLPNGLISLKGGMLNEEFKEIRKKEYVEETSISDYFSEEYFETKKIIYIQR